MPVSAPAAATLAAPEPRAGTDGLETEWVLVWMPPAFLTQIRDRLRYRLAGLGLWELQTEESYYAGEAPRYDFDGPRDTSQDQLARHVSWTLGFPVSLEPGQVEMQLADDRHQPAGPVHVLPFYWIRPAG